MELRVMREEERDKRMQIIYVRKQVEEEEWGRYKSPVQHKTKKQKKTDTERQKMKLRATMREGGRERENTDYRNEATGREGGVRTLKVGSSNETPKKQTLGKRKWNCER